MCLAAKRLPWRHLFKNAEKICCLHIWIDGRWNCRTRVRKAMEVACESRLWSCIWANKRIKKLFEESFERSNRSHIRMKSLWNPRTCTCVYAFISFRECLRVTPMQIWTSISRKKQVRKSCEAGGKIWRRIKSLRMPHNRWDGLSTLSRNASSYWSGLRILRRRKTRRSLSCTRSTFEISFACVEIVIRIVRLLEECLERIWNLQNSP